MAGADTFQAIAAGLTVIGGSVAILWRMLRDAPYGDEIEGVGFIYTEGAGISPDRASTGGALVANNASARPFDNAPAVHPDDALNAGDDASFHSSEVPDA